MNLYNNKIVIYYSVINIPINILYDNFIFSFLEISKKIIIFQILRNRN